MTSHDLERRVSARNRPQFYAIAVTRTRFGGWALVRETGFETEGAASRAGIVETRSGAGAQCIPRSGNAGRARRRPEAKGWVRGEVTAADREAEA